LRVNHQYRNHPSTRLSGSLRAPIFLMIISTDHRIVFMAIPKTGTRSIYACMKEYFGGIVTSDHARSVPLGYKHFYLFTVVRNPYHRAVSIWWSTCKRNNDKRHFISKYLKEDNTFLNFCRRIGDIDQGENLVVTHRQAEWLRSNYFDKILRFENLNKEWLDMPFNTKQIPLDNINSTTAVRKGSLGPGNPVARGPYDQYLCNESIDLINKYYSQDFILAGYKKIET